MGITTIIRILLVAAPVLTYLVTTWRDKIEIRARVQAAHIEEVASCKLKLAEAGRSRDDAARDFAHRLDEAEAGVSTPADLYRRCLICAKEQSCRSHPKILSGEIKCEDLKP